LVSQLPPALKASIPHLDHVSGLDGDQEAAPDELHGLVLGHLLVHLEEAILPAALADDLA
jgi:hypothetical protein